MSNLALYAKATLVASLLLASGGRAFAATAGPDRIAPVPRGEALASLARQLEEQARAAREHAEAVARLSAEVQAGKRTHAAFLRAVRPHVEALARIEKTLSSGEFAVVTGLDAETEVVEYREGDAARDAARREHELTTESLSQRLRSREIGLSEFLRLVAPHAEALAVAESKDYFARSQYQEMKDSEKLSAPAFEDMGAMGMHPNALPLKEALDRYGKAMGRLTEAMRRLVSLAHGGIAGMAEVVEIMRSHQESIQRAHAELQPAMRRAAELMQPPIVAAMRGEPEPPPPDPAEVAALRATIDGASAALEAAALSLELALSALPSSW